jgi:hypothetical protein
VCGIVAILLLVGYLAQQQSKAIKRDRVLQGQTIQEDLPEPALNPADTGLVGDWSREGVPSSVSFRDSGRGYIDGAIFDWEASKAWVRIADAGETRSIPYSIDGDRLTLGNTTFQRGWRPPSFGLEVGPENYPSKSVEPLKD